MTKNNIPIWLSKWTIEHTPGKGDSTTKIVPEVLVKGLNVTLIMNYPDHLRHAIYILEKRQKKIDDKLLNQYKVINVELIKQIGCGIDDLKSENEISRGEINR